MDELFSSAAAALEIMREWEWPRVNYEGETIHPSKELSEVVNRIAMGVVLEPHATILRLLCSGELVARGDYICKNTKEENISRWRALVKP